MSVLEVADHTVGAAPPPIRERHPPTEPTPSRGLAQKCHECAQEYNHRRNPEPYCALVNSIRQPLVSIGESDTQLCRAWTRNRVDEFQMNGCEPVSTERRPPVMPMLQVVL